jgi:hypothetical protein
MKFSRIFSSVLLYASGIGIFLLLLFGALELISNRKAPTPEAAGLIQPEVTQNAYPFPEPVEPSLTNGEETPYPHPELQIIPLSPPDLEPADGDAPEYGYEANPAYPPPQQPLTRPTSTPYPTPTRRPGPTLSPLPLPTPAADPQGEIWYGTKPLEGYNNAHYRLAVDAAGSAADQPTRVVMPPGLASELALRTYALHPSPDGRFLLLEVSSDPLATPFVLDLTDMSFKEVLVGYAPGYFLGWRRDSLHFLFFVDGGGPWLVNAETSEVTMLDVNLHIQGGAISPDGSLVVYIKDKAVERSMWMVSIAGSDARYLFDTSWSHVYPTSWSPDGTKIVYYGSCKVGGETTGSFCLYDLETGEIRLLKLPFTGGNPSWSPDSRYIAATGFTTGEKACFWDPNLTPLETANCFYIGSSVFVEDLQSGELRELAQGILPVWSPDGTMLAYLSLASGSQEVWIIQADGSNPRQVTHDGQIKLGYLIWR